ncbi:ATP-dependent zinc metalloprotease FtsH [Haliangium sp.]|uniref:ATP-dependent zinc metalloprotease FtsH n=1 Tax=Haliangium sp. TaxID=2663208 RepID=UPI003D125F5F
MKQSYKTVLLWVLLILMFVSIYQLFTDSGGKQDTLDVAAFKAMLQTRIDAREGQADLTDEQKEQLERANTIARVEVEPRPHDNAHYTIHYWKEGTVEPKEEAERTTVVKGEFKGTIEDLMTTAGISYQVESKEEGTFWQSLIISWLPMLVLFALFFFFMRQLQSGGGKAMSFGKSKAKLLTDHQNKITFKDVAGVEEAKEEVEEIIAFLKDPKKFTRLGGRIPKGVLMMGPPGTGKTLLARAIAGEAGVPFFSISGSDFVEMFVGVGASRVRDLFEQGKKNAPCIIFIDEIDAVGRHRGAGLGGGHDEREQTLNQLLVEMDGFESNEGVILIAATNRPDVLDPALLRPGRFDRRIVVPRPDLRGRTGILAVHTSDKVPVADEVDLEVLARGTPGFSGADLESLVNEAALIAARRNKDRVFMEDFEDAKDKVLMGAERRSMFISDKEKRTTAYHEAGHATVARLVGTETDPVHKVSIIPRGRALGVTQQLPTEDRLGLTREYALNRIAILMGGRVAEEIVLKQKTTGAGDDIDKATDLARRMVTEWGMSDVIGPLNFARGKQEVFLGRDFSQGDAYSEETAQRIDGEIRRLVTEQYERARRLLEENRDLLERVAQALLEYETLDSNDIDVLDQGGTITRQAPLRKAQAAVGGDDGGDRKKRPSLFPPLGKQEPDPEPEPA